MACQGHDLFLYTLTPMEYIVKLLRQREVSTEPCQMGNRGANVLRHQWNYRGTNGGKVAHLKGGIEGNMCYPHEQTPYPSLTLMSEGAQGLHVGIDVLKAKNGLQ
jgi:hypothetical protein